MRKIIIITVITIAALGIVVVGAVVGWSIYLKAAYVTPATSLGRTFMSALFSGADSTAYNMTSSSSRQKTSLDKFTAEVADYRTPSATITNEKVVLSSSNNAADYYADIQKPFLQTQLVRLHLVQANGGWQVDSLTTMPGPDGSTP